MKKVKILVLLLTIGFQSFAQFPDNTHGRLALLCKTWGFLKYHHTNKCNVDWNALLISKVDSVFNAGSNAQFNDILFNLCLETGLTLPPSQPVIIQSDSAKNYHTSWFNDPGLSNNVRYFLDTVKAHAFVDTFDICTLKFNDYSDPNYSSFVDFRKDSIFNIPNFTYANLAHRLNVYFYYWNVVNYFFPQIDIADHHWDSTLYTFMPHILNANNDSSFTMALAQVVSRIDDTHGFFPNSYVQEYLSDMPAGQSYYTNKIALARIENKHVVRLSSIPGIYKGDVIQKINGRDLDSLFVEHSKYIAASNQITKYRIFYTNLFDGTFGTTKSVQLLDSNNNLQQVAFSCNINYSQYYNWLNGMDQNPTWQITKCGYGYVHMGKLESADVPTMYNALKNTPAIIFDIRNYPNGTLWDLKTILFPAPNISANFFIPDLSYPGYYSIQNDMDNFGIWNNPDPYTGQIIILVNEETQSQAEYTAQTLRTHPNAIIIGSQTAGADGNVAYLDLPGNISTYWSGIGWYQANWHNPQRAGVQVDSVVHPTIMGIRQGIDEVLEKAFNCPTSIPDNPMVSSLKIVQSPGYLNLSNEQDPIGHVEIFNLQGQCLYSHQASGNRLDIPIHQYARGMYILQVQFHNQVSRTHKFSVR